MYVRLSGSLLNYVGHNKALHYDAASVREGLSMLADEYPPLKLTLLDHQGKVQQFHRVFLNGEQLTAAELDRSAGREDEVEIVTAIAGG